MPKRTPKKNAPTRDRQKVHITPEQALEAQIRFSELAKTYRNPPGLGTRRKLEFNVLGATIDGDTIHLSVVVTGSIETPTDIATSKGQTIPLVVPAKVERKGDETTPDSPVECDDDFIPFPDLG